MKIIQKALLGCLTFLTAFSSFASDPFIGEMRYFAGNFEPRGWAFCEGQTLQIAQYTALFSLLGTMYGGDGRTTFKLPDMRGKALLHFGNGPGLSNTAIGQNKGQKETVLTANQLPNHSHTVNVSNTTADASEPASGTLSSARIYRDRAPNGTLHTDTVSNTGAGQAVNLEQPYIAIRCIIALEGTYPSRS